MKERLFTRNFLLLMFGQVSSLFGNSILRLALSMYILDQTGSAAVFGSVLSAAVLPTILLSPLGGFLADRMNRRNLMVLLDALTGLAVLATALVLSCSDSIVPIVILLMLLSVLGAFETPAVQACIPSMLSGENIIRGNALVNQAAAISGLVAPALGGLLYAAFGLVPVMYASVLCFFATALSECFIRLGSQPISKGDGLLSMVWQDLSLCARYLYRERPSILKLLFLVAFSGFFVIGVAAVGFPYLVRTVLGLDARYYGAAESALAMAALGGSIAAGALVGKLRTARLAGVLAALGACLLPVGGIFLIPAGGNVRYFISLAAFCGMQAAVSIFSLFALSLIQRDTPDNLMGKVMAYTSAITLCAQPLGQLVYGFLFERFREAVYLVLLPTAGILFAVGWMAKGFFREMEREEMQKKGLEQGSSRG